MKTEPIKPTYQEKKGMWTALLITLLFYAAVCALIAFLSACAGTEYITKGYIESPFGSAYSDGKTLTYTPPPPRVFTIPLHPDK